MAALVVAGGQGTRLGHAGPKSTFPLGPVSGRTLFGLQAEKLRRQPAPHGQGHILSWTRPRLRCAQRAEAIGSHAFALEFLERCAARSDEFLPLHASAKPIPYVGPDGATVAPPEPNGYKLERFVFDLLPEARSCWSRPCERTSTHP